MDSAVHQSVRYCGACDVSIGSDLYADDILDKPGKVLNAVNDGPRANFHGGVPVAILGLDVYLVATAAVLWYRFHRLHSRDILYF